MFAFFGIAVLVWALWPLFTILFLVAVGYALLHRTLEAMRDRKQRLGRQAVRAAVKKEAAAWRELGVMRRPRD